MEEWEKQRRNELEQHRQRETEKVLMLRAKKETLAAELENAVIYYITLETLKCMFDNGLVFSVALH